MPAGKKESAIPPKKPAGALKEFLNPHSMLTPGACGAITMLITNTLAAQFGAPPNYTGLGISFLFGLIVFAATSTTLWLRLVFWLLNSLIIFSIALGTNQAGVRASKNIRATEVMPSPLASIMNPGPPIPLWPVKAFFANWLDGTVPRRNALVTQIQNIDESEAEKTLKELGIKYENPESAKTILTNSAATGQTLERVSEIQRAVAKVKSEAKSEIGPGEPK